MPFWETRQRKIPHYHGDIVRKLFIAAGILMLVTLPVFRELFPISSLTLIISVVILIIFAALTNPKLRWVNIVDVLISAFGVILFEFFAVLNYATDIVPFLTSQGLAIIFLFALYYSARTARAIATGQLDTDAIPDDEPDEPESFGEEKSNEDLLHDIEKGKGY